MAEEKEEKKYMTVDDAFTNYAKDNKNIGDLVQAAIDLSAHAEAKLLKLEPIFNDTYNAINKALEEKFYNKSLNGVDTKQLIGDRGEEIKQILIKHFTSELESTPEGKADLASIKKMGLTDEEYDDTLLKTISSRHVNEKGEQLFDYVDLLNNKKTKLGDIYATIKGGMRADSYSSYLQLNKMKDLGARISEKIPLHAARNLVNEYAKLAGHGIHKNIMHMTDPASLILQTALKLKQGTFKDKTEAEKLGIKLNAYRSKVKDSLDKTNDLKPDDSYQLPKAA